MVILIASCGKKESPDDQDANGVNFTSIKSYDVDANYLGNIGSATDDYKNEEWPQWVMDFFQPLDTVNVTGYVKSECSIDALYPNSCGNLQHLRYFATQPANLKIVIIDGQKHVYMQKSYHLYQGIHIVDFDYTLLNMAAGAYFRMFYTFSAEGDYNFKKGHIDIYKEN